MGYLTHANIDSTDYTLAGALYGTCSTAAGTAAKVVTLAAFDSLETGVTIHVKFTYSNTAANATLNVNSTGAKSIMAGTNVVGTTTKTSWQAGSVVSFTYDGTAWLMNDYIPDTNDNTDTKVKQTATTTNSDYPILFKNSANQTAETDQVRYGNTSNKIPKINPSTGDITGATLNGLWLGADGAGYAVIENSAGGYWMLTDVLSSGGVKTLSIQGADSQASITARSNYVLQDACAKAVDDSIASGSTSTNLPTTAAVRAYVDQVAGAAAAGALVYQGTVGTDGDIADLPAAHTKGWYYIVKTAGTYAGVSCEAGDMIICKNTGTTASNADWDVIQANIISLTTAEIDTDWAAA